MEQLVGPVLKHSDGSDVPLETLLQSKVIALYFSASWCPPCRKFTETLKDFYEEVNQKDKVFEVVLIPFDKEESAAKEYHAKMPWLSTGFNNPVNTPTSKKFEVTGIPKLIVFDAEGNVLSTDGRKDVTVNGPPIIEKWITKK